MSDHKPAGRRASVARRRRVDILVALALVLPAVVAVAIGVIGEERTPLAGLRPPTTVELTSSTVVCPGGTGTTSTARAGRSPGVAGGELAVLAAPPDGAVAVAGVSVTVTEGVTAVVPDSAGPVVLDGQGAAAPGITAGRDDPLAVPECRPPAYDEWLVGLGATARYATTLELVNPDDGEAVVDVALHDEEGPAEEPALRGIQVPAHGVQRIDLATAAPRRGTTAAHVTVTRGRVSVTARNTSDQLGRGRSTTDFLPSQAEPDTENLILGLDGARNATLVVANPGDDEVRAQLRLVTADATFTPTGAPDVSVPPHAVREVDLRPLLTGDNAAGVLGVLIESAEPVVASVRLMQRKDLALLAPAIAVREPTAAVLPVGEKTLLLGHASRNGVVHVRSYAADGTVLREDQVEVAPDRAAALDLPPEAVLVAVEPRTSRVAGVVMLPVKGAQPGLATLRLRPAETHARIPAVAPE
ncbi:hypothetical protein KVF89_09270 [Nocardioides carbamazepini]|uniref:DUF5719 family protein n=1 Tax=Nocardioides carbamazepini TaxID=2854259 RepID=UPI002149AD74|nr:DUF5719 family protein [Nocardioides carbamazepini]MCR1782721.1 hypothetical protein [Nocardioides carbamazepini]